MSDHFHIIKNDLNVYSKGLEKLDDSKGNEKRAKKSKQDLKKLRSHLTNAPLVELIDDGIGKIFDNLVKGLAYDSVVKAVIGNEITKVNKAYNKLIKDRNAKVFLLSKDPSSVKPSEMPALVSFNDDLYTVVKGEVKKLNMPKDDTEAWQSLEGNGDPKSLKELKFNGKATTFDYYRCKLIAELKGHDFTLG